MKLDCNKKTKKKVILEYDKWVKETNILANKYSDNGYLPSSNEMISIKTIALMKLEKVK